MEQDGLWLCYFQTVDHPLFAADFFLRCLALVYFPFSFLTAHSTLLPVKIGGEVSFFQEGIMFGGYYVQGR